MDLNLEISPRITGRVEVPLVATVVRGLTELDLPLLDVKRQSNSERPLNRISERHHAAARLIAQGMKQGEVAAITGYSVSRIGLLSTDPAFRELVQFYRTDINRETRSNFERLSGLTADAADILQDRMENEPEKVSTAHLVEIVKVGADRSGNGPISGSVTVNINAGIADRMKRAREAARVASIDITALDVTPREAAE